MSTHKELLTALKFDEKFRNALRKYYSYGFKPFNNEDKTILDDWNRLNSILNDCLQWDRTDGNKKKNKGDNKKQNHKGKPKEVRFASVDSQSLKENPFERLYRFCKYSHLDYLLHTMFAFELELKDDFAPCYLDQAIDKLAIKSPDVTNAFLGEESPDKLNGIIAGLDLTKRQKAELEEAVIRGMSLKTAQIAEYFPESLRAKNQKDKDKNKTPNDRLKDMEKLGLIHCFQRIGGRGANGDRYWRKNKVSISELINIGERADDDFRSHFLWALDFFSRYFSFGEIGMFLIDRINEGYQSALRFKNEYYMHALNDFNIIDLLGAIERNEWCKISYKHGTDNITKTELLCYPLEIRTSSSTGRQTLMFYEPFQRSCTGLRIEFIDKIECYKDSKIREIFQAAPCPWKLSPREIDSDISNARELIKHTWGVSTTKVTPGNIIGMPDLSHVVLEINYDAGKEYFITNRIKREVRNGKYTIQNDQGIIRYEVDVSDSMEMRPWVRSFYSRVLSCEGVDFGEKSFEDDLEKMANSNRPSGQYAGKTSNNTQKQPWRIPAGISLGKGIPAEDHKYIFNSIFSIYSYIILNVIENIGLRKEISESILDECIEDAICIYQYKTGKQTGEVITREVKEFIKNKGFVEPNNHKQNSFKPKYNGVKATYWYETMIPLTTMEIRWLKSIFADRKMEYFLSDQEKQALCKYLDKAYPDLHPFPVEKMKVYDSYHFSDKAKKREKGNIKVFLAGRYAEKKLRIKYKTRKGDYIEEIFMPIVLEFSKRQNRFQVYVQSCTDLHFYTFNVAGIEKIEILEEKFDTKLVDEAFEKYRSDLFKHVDIYFDDQKNMPDRILTEFSPWKKKCTYDEEKGVYHLTVYYQTADKLDLVIRLMGYGSGIYIEKDHEIATEIEARLMKQREIIEKRRGNTERGE